MEKTSIGLYKLPFGKAHLLKMRNKFTNRFERAYQVSITYVVNRGLVLAFIAFLLGRALILTELTPFALPFFAAVYFKYRERVPIASIGLILGTLSISVGQALYTIISIVIFVLFYELIKRVSKGTWQIAPVCLFLTALFGKFSYLFLSSEQTLLIISVTSLIEAILAFILLFIFTQSLTLLTVKRRIQPLKTEEIVSLIIMVASILSGTIGWYVAGLSVEHIMSRYLVVLFALVAGATVGSTVGVVTGLIFSLANIASLFQMSLLAFAGLLSGLLKDARKIGVAFGLIIATLLIGMYDEMNGPIIQTIGESAVAIGLIVLTPSIFLKRLAKHIPGTEEYMNEQQQYLRKVRDVTAQRVAKFSTVFQALSNSFAQFESFIEDDDEERELDLFLSNVTEKTCQSCHRKMFCWSKRFATTYDLMAAILYELENNDSQLSYRLKRDWRNHCLRSAKVIETIKEQITFLQANKKLKKQVQESRRLVAEQLLGVSEVMEDFATEIKKERLIHDFQEKQIYKMFDEFGIEVDQVEIYSLERGNIDIDLVIPFCQDVGECDKIIAPLLSNILDETIITEKGYCPQQITELCHVTFRSAQKYVVSTGVAHVAQDGGLISGDSFATGELGGGKYALAISDGMGNGERAFKESQETLKLLQKILQSGIEEKVAIKSINSILSLRTTDEIFSTLDLALIDLQDANAKFLKISSIPSFVKTSQGVKKIEASNLPIGMLAEFDVDVVRTQLHAGDILVMMSDGVFEGPNLIENCDVWFKRKIKEIETNCPQEIADLIIEEVIRARDGEIPDDMTVVVAKITHNIPKWAPIPLKSFQKKLSG